MTDLELLECAQSVYDFIIDGTKHGAAIRLNKSFNSFMEVPVFKKMNETLVKYDFADMVLFTLTLNSKWKIYEQNDFRKLLRSSPKDFFSSTKSHDFYRTILRDLKLKQCLNYRN